MSQVLQTLLITGLTGKSGLIFAKDISCSNIKESYKIRASVRPSSRTDLIKEILPEAELIKGDLRDNEYLKMITRDVDVLFHIAGINLSLPLVEASVLNNVKRIVLVHTTGIYSKYKAAGEHYRSIDREVEKMCRGGYWINDSSSYNDLWHSAGSKHDSFYKNGRQAESNAGC